MNLGVVKAEMVVEVVLLMVAGQQVAIQEEEDREGQIACT